MSTNARGLCGMVMVVVALGAVVPTSAAEPQASRRKAATKQGKAAVAEPYQIRPARVSGDEVPAPWGPYYLVHQKSTRSKEEDEPKEGRDYWECKHKECEEITFEVWFDPRHPQCPDVVLPSVQNCTTGHNLLSCAAMKRALKVKFLSGDYAYRVRFSPFGCPIVVPDKGGKPPAWEDPKCKTGPIEWTIQTDAPVAWYKFTVDSMDPACKGVPAVDPNIIVTK